MFENEIKFIGDLSLRKIKKLGSVVTFEKLADAGLHPAIVTYISAELDYMIHRDRKKLLKDSIFDYSGKEISEHFKIISKEIKQNKKISIEDISKLIIQAVSFNANFVVRPKWSLTKFIYNDQNFITVEELGLMLNYLYYYDYIKNVLAAYISKRKIVQLTLTEFDLVLNKIDRELFKSNAEELINNALYSIADFFSIGGADKNRLDLTSVEILLKEKNLMDSLLKLRRTVPGISQKKYEISDIKKVLYATTPLKPGSIKGYDPDKIELFEESSEDEPAIEKTMVDFDIDDSEIVKEEEILNPPRGEKQIIFDDIEPEQEGVLQEEPVNDEKDDLLPIEKEFLDEFELEETPEQEQQIEENTVETPAIDETQSEVLAELENELNELIEKSFNYEDEPAEEKPDVEQPVIEDKTEEEIEPEAETSGDDDELLTFYENELALIDDDDSDLVIVTEEELNQPADEAKNDASESSKQELDIEGELESVDNEESNKNEDDVLTQDDFDLSIFEEAELDKPELQSEKPDAQIPLKDEIKEEASPTFPPEKEIINEMLEDYFQDENKKEMPGSKEEPFILADDEFELKSEDVFSDTQLGSSIFDDTSMNEHISNVIDEIDELLKEEAPVVKDEKKEEFPKEISKKEKKSSKDIIKDAGKDSEKDLFGSENKEDKKSAARKKEEPPKEIKSSIPKSETPNRKKDFFNYLTKKEMRKIVSSVFGSDDGDFVTTIEKISECSSYKEATEILKGVFFSYRVSPYSKEAVLLTNAVSNFFRQA